MDRVHAELRSSRIAVAAIFGLNGATFANWLARIPDVKLTLGVGEGLLGLILLFAAIGALIAQPITGWLCGRYGSRQITTVFALCYSLAIFLPANANSTPLLMAALFVFGALNGGLDVAMNAQAALVEAGYKRPIMNSFHGVWSVGALFGAVIGGWATGQGLAVNIHLMIVGVLGCLGMFIASHGLVADGATADAGGHGFALPPPALLLMGFIGFGVLLCEGAIADWGAIYLRDDLHSSPGISSIGYAAFALMMAAGRLSGDWLVERFGAARFVRAGGALILLGIGLALSSPFVVLSIIGFGLVGAGLAGIFPLIISAAARTPQISANTAIAAMATMGYTGFLIGPPLIGGVAELISLRVALGLLGLVGVLVVVAGGTIDRGQQSA